MDAVFRDFLYSLRRFRQNPGFAAIVVLTLALGIGANTAIFSVVNAVLWRPLPYTAPDRLVTINHFYQSKELNNLEAPVSAIGFRDYRDKTKSFESVAVETGWSANLTGTGDPERIPASRVSGLYFRVLGVAAQLGRTLQVDEDVPGKNRVVVISDALWRRAFAADSGVTRKTVELNGETYQIVGVMPADFFDFFNTTAELWTPLALAASTFDPNNYTNEYLNLTARLKPGISQQQAASEMTAFADGLRKLYPNNFGPRWTLKVTSINERATAAIQTTLLVLLGAVGFVLLIACANVANLLLARAAVRIKEFAIRTALGADRWSIVRQLLAESVLLALVGGVLGLGLAFYGIRTLVAVMPTLPRASSIGIDGPVLAFTLGISVFTGILFGLAPALQTARTNLQHTLKEGGRSGSADFSGRNVRRALVVAEMALALMLLTGAGLLIKSVARLQSLSPGFNPTNLLTFNVALPRVKYTNDTVRTQFYSNALAAVNAVPGVAGAGATSNIPFGGNWGTASFNIEGYNPQPGQPSPWGDVRIVSEDFFKAMGVRLLAGRAFAPQDLDGSAKVVVVDREFVKRFGQERDAVGRRIYFDGPPNAPRDYLTIVGVVDHTMHEGLDADPRIQVYFPYRQAQGINQLGFAVRTTGDPLKVVNAVRQAIRSVDRDMPISQVRTMDALIERSMGSRRLSMILLSAFSLIAIVLASIGIYGVMSYSVTQRSREIGIRMALGSARADVLAMMVRQGMTLAAGGVAIGLAGAVGLTRLLTSQLYAIDATDPSTFAGVSAALLGIALMAVLVPAMRATRVDPVVALREE